MIVGIAQIYIAQVYSPLHVNQGCRAYTEKIMGTKYDLGVRRKRRQNRFHRNRYQVTKKTKVLVYAQSQITIRNKH